MSDSVFIIDFLKIFLNSIFIGAGSAVGTYLATKHFLKGIEKLQSKIVSLNPKIDSELPKQPKAETSGESARSKD